MEIVGNCFNKQLCDSFITQASFVSSYTMFSLCTEENILKKEGLINSDATQSDSYWKVINCSSGIKKRTNKEKIASD